MHNLLCYLFLFLEIPKCDCNVCLDPTWKTGEPLLICSEYEMRTISINFELGLAYF